jgi:hypothetical protein
VTRGSDHLPAVELVTRLEAIRIGLEPYERQVPEPLLDELVRDVRRHAVATEPLAEHVAPAFSAPDERALLVVDTALGDGRPGERRKVGRRADVVGMEVGDHDPRDRPAGARELGAPALGRVGQPEPRVHDRPSVLAGKQVGVHVPRPRRERERDAPYSVGQLVHSRNPMRRPKSRRHVSRTDVLTQNGV